ncbi:MAG: 4-alpha-glucanotransferase, partial [Elusimicrobiaceae bacterium]|nr:4-alpha-glucanotransferase [Elusimicrobiaceae bacterium]
MKLHFHIHYQTRWGESLHAVLYRENAAPNEHKINIPLSTNDGANWQGEGLFLLKQTLRLHYHYEVRAGAKVLRREWQTVPRLLVLQPDTTSYFMTDQWRDLPADAWTYSSGIARVLRRRPRGRNLSFSRFQHTLELRAQTGCPSPEEELCVCGNCPALGNWDPRQALPLQEILTNEWILSLDADRLPPIFEYKFLLRHPRTGKITWEQGPNRQQQNKLLPAHSCWIQSDLRPRFSSQTVFRAAGVVIPVFSLRSKRDWGCGDFGLLEKLVDWAVQTGQKVIQLLPVNDTTLTNTWQDSYPYKAVSIYALHPLYTRMDTLPAASRRVEKRFEKERQKLSALSQVDYEAVLQLKLKRLQVAFEQEGEHVLETEEFRRFFHKNARWLPAYA